MVLFDFGGTLDADGTRWSIRFHDAYRNSGGCLPFDQFEPLFRESDRQLAEEPGIGTAGFQVTLEAQSKLLAALLARQGEAISAADLAAPVHRSAVALAARNRRLLTQLADEHRLGVVSNYTGNLVVCLEELDLLAPFSMVIDSARVGVSKPDPRIFQLALIRLGAERAPGWMVGDSPTADLLPAASLGLKTCWLTPAGERRVLPPGVPTVRIAHLPQVADVLAEPCMV